MSNFDEDKNKSNKAGFSKILSLGDYKNVTSNAKTSTRKASSESGSVTVEIKRKRPPFVGGLSLPKNNTTGLYLKKT